MNILLGMKILWIFSGVITKLGYIGVISMHFRVFSWRQGTLKDKVQNPRYFLKFLIFILG